MTAYRLSVPRLGVLLCLPLLAGCVSGGPRAAGAFDAPPPAVPAVAAPPGPASDPVLSGPAVSVGPPMVSWTSPSPVPSPAPSLAPPSGGQGVPGAQAPQHDEVSVPRQPPRRPGPTQGSVPPRRPAPAPSAAPSPTLPGNACDGLAQYGVFPVGGTAHQWCLTQQQAY